VRAVSLVLTVGRGFRFCLCVNVIFICEWSARVEGRLQVFRLCLCVILICNFESSARGEDTL
jgi:hypothetical protein